MDVVAAVFVDGAHVLACRRHVHRAAGGLWEFPGGKREPGESAPDALRREIAEELGVDVAVGDLLDRSTTMVAGVAVRLACYLVRPLGGRPETSTDHDQLCWFARDRLRWLRWAAPDLPAVRLLGAQDFGASTGMR